MSNFNIDQALSALEEVCDNQTALVSYHLPQLSQIVETILLLPRAQQEEYMDRLNRISVILEGQMMSLAEELEQLRKQIPAVQNSNAASQAYQRVVAVLPVKSST